MTTNKENGILRFDQFRRANVARCFRFHEGGVKDWKAEYWAEAIVGEVGEFFNELKKVRRGDGSYTRVLHELVDVYTYADLLDARMGAAVPGPMNVDDFCEDIDEHLREVFKFKNGTEEMLDTVKGALIYGQYATYSASRAFDIAESNEMSFEDKDSGAFLGCASLSLWLMRHYGTKNFPPSYFMVEKFNAVSMKRGCPERFVLLDGEWTFATK